MPACMFKEMLLDTGFPDLGVVDELINGASLTGEVPATGMLPGKFTPAVATDSEVRASATRVRPKLDSDNAGSGDSTIDKEVWRKSDHRAFQGCVRTPSPAEVNEKFEMVPTNKYCPKDPADLFRWTEVLDTGWDRVKEAWGTWLAGWASRVEQTPSEVPRPDKQAMVDQIRREFNFHLEEFLQKQAVQAEQMGVGMRCHKKPQRRKCDLRDYPSYSSNKIRVWIRLWGRLCEAERLQHVDCSDLEVKQLWKKIVRCRYFKHGMTAADAATEVQILLSETQKTRLQAWKKKLRDDSTLVFKWVRQKPASPTINIHPAPRGVAAHTAGYFGSYTLNSSALL